MSLHGGYFRGQQVPYQKDSCLPIAYLADIHGAALRFSSYRVCNREGHSSSLWWKSPHACLMLTLLPGAVTLNKKKISLYICPSPWADEMRRKRRILHPAQFMRFKSCGMPYAHAHMATARPLAQMASAQVFRQMTPLHDAGKVARCKIAAYGDTDLGCKTAWVRDVASVAQQPQPPPE